MIEGVGWGIASVIIILGLIRLYKNRSNGTVK
jgi:hypothetical protein